LKKSNIIEEQIKRLRVLHLLFSLSYKSPIPLLEKIIAVPRTAFQY